MKQVARVRPPLARGARKAKSPPIAPAEPDDKWTFLSNHCHVLLVLTEDAELPLREVALRVGITERSVQRIVTDLEGAGYLKKERVGRANRYQITNSKHLRHPLEAHCTIDSLIDWILRKRP